MSGFGLGVLGTMKDAKMKEVTPSTRTGKTVPKFADLKYQLATLIYLPFTDS